MTRRHQFLHRRQEERERSEEEGGSPAVQKRTASWDVQALQRTVGNQAVGRLLAPGAADRELTAGQDSTSEGSAGDVQVVQSQLGQGRPLDGSVRSRMQSLLGADLSQVRVHTDGQAAGLVRQRQAQALAVGQDVAFAPGNYRPGTPAGDALIAHELAHVAQQQTASHSSSTRSLGQISSAALERDADRSAAGLVSSLWSGLKGTAGRIADSMQGPRPALRSGLRVQLGSCFGTSRRIEAPDFLGPHSRETFNTIKRRLESADLLEDMLIAGPLIVLLTSSPLETAAGGGYPLEQQVDAVRSVDVIIRARVGEDIDWLFLEHGNDLTEEERLYWERMRRVLTQAGSR